ncbi:MAG: hypothetical protein WCJ95_17580 [Mariniphaga sp.]
MIIKGSAAAYKSENVAVGSANVQVDIDLAIDFNLAVSIRDNRYKA